MAKKIIDYIKLQIPINKANPSPLVGPALSQRGLNIMELHKTFNTVTRGMEPSLSIPVVIIVSADKSFTFVMKTPPVSILLKEVAGLQEGSSNPLTSRTGKLTRAQLEKTAKIKEPGLTAADLDAAVRTIVGSTRSAGLDVEGVV